MKKKLSNFVPTRKTKRYDTDKLGRTPLHEAVDRRDTEMVNVLLAAKAYIHARDDTGDTPLHWAMRRGDTEVMQFLIANGAK